MTYRKPTPQELESPLFNSIWDIIKEWDVSRPEDDGLYSGCNGNHVCEIMGNLPNPHNPMTNNLPTAQCKEHGGHAVIPEPYHHGNILRKWFMCKLLKKHTPNWNLGERFCLICTKKLLPDCPKCND